MIVFVDLRKAFDSLPTATILQRLIDMNFSWNLVHSVCSLMNVPRGRLCGSDKTFVMGRGVRQGSKEGPLLFNITFQLILEKAFRPCDDELKLRDEAGEVWKLGHIKYADDLCVLAPSIATARWQTEQPRMGQRSGSILGVTPLWIA